MYVRIRKNMCRKIHNTADYFSYFGLTFVLITHVKYIAVCNAIIAIAVSNLLVKSKHFLSVS